MKDYSRMGIVVLESRQDNRNEAHLPIRRGTFVFSCVLATTSISLALIMLIKRSSSGAHNEALAEYRASVQIAV